MSTVTFVNARLAEYRSVNITKVLDITLYRRNCDVYSLYKKISACAPNDFQVVLVPLSRILQTRWRLLYHQYTAN